MTDGAMSLGNDDDVDDDLAVELEWVHVVLEEAFHILARDKAATLRLISCLSNAAEDYVDDDGIDELCAADVMTDFYRYATQKLMRELNYKIN